MWWKSSCALDRGADAEQEGWRMKEMGSESLLAGKINRARARVGSLTLDRVNGKGAFDLRCGVCRMSGEV